MKNKYLIAIFVLVGVLINFNLALGQEATSTPTGDTSTSTLATTTTTVATTTATSTEINNNSTSTTDLAFDKIRSLMQEIEALREKIIEVLINNLNDTQADTEKVKLLQRMLSADRDVYPQGLVTGYFGSLTNKAILKFKAKKLERMIGNQSASSTDSLWGPARLIQEGAGNSGQVPPGLLNAPGLRYRLGTTTYQILPSKKVPFGINNKLKNNSVDTNSASSTATTTDN